MRPLHVPLLSFDLLFSLLPPKQFHKFWKNETALGDEQQQHHGENPSCSATWEFIWWRALAGSSQSIRHLVFRLRTRTRWVGGLKRIKKFADLNFRFNGHQMKNCSAVELIDFPFTNPSIKVSISLLFWQFVVNKLPWLIASLSGWVAQRKYSCHKRITKSHGHSSP